MGLWQAFSLTNMEDLNDIKINNKVIKEIQLPRAQVWEQWCYLESSPIVAQPTQQRRECTGYPPPLASVTEPPRSASAYADVCHSCQWQFSSTRTEDETTRSGRHFQPQTKI